MMSRDFTLKKYSELVLALLSKYRTMTVADYISMPIVEKHVAIMRHDVARNPEKAAKLALWEKQRGLRSTYYFRWDPKAVYWSGTGAERYGNFPELAVVEAKLYGHEVGMLCDSEDVLKKLERLNTLAPVRTAVGYSSEELLGDPDTAPEFSEFVRFSDADRKWSSDGLIEALKAGKHPLVIISITPGKWL